MKRILVTGAAGQVGSELVPELRRIYGEDSVLATDVRSAYDDAGPYQHVDCMDIGAISDAVHKHKADTIYHLAALLSATSEMHPQKAFRINMGTLANVLEVARENNCAVFTPSSIGAFGPSTPKDPTPQDTVQRPSTMYGVTKVAGELLCDYYFTRFGVDTRGLRYPGLISYVTSPGGGTTDYAVHIFYDALQKQEYTCFLSENTQLDMMYMPDAVRASIEIMEADGAKLKHRNAFNVTAMQLTPGSLSDLIKQRIPDFKMNYAIDPVRQRIAESWPKRLDDSAPSEEWGWKAEYGVEAMVDDMLKQLRAKLGAA
jgi:nucleoside-diphosphate-sugar epimerase